MTFVKVTKNKAYFSRYQVKYRRRREGKTDYRARRRLVSQDKNKYNTPKHRFVVRMTNKKIICQVIYATIVGDRVMEAADSTELKQYGIEVGYTNYAAAYATGLLLARRLLKKLELDKAFTGNDEVNGTYFEQGPAEDRRPFTCYLDVGLVRTTTGHRVFGAMKGAVDGGLKIPHSEKRFPGYSKKGGDDSYDPEKHVERIFAGHVGNLMNHLEEEDPDRFKAQFSDYIKAGVKADELRSLFEAAHQKIRASPDRVKKVRVHPPVCVREGDMIRTHKGSYLRKKKLTPEQRRERVGTKLRMVAEMAGVATEE